MPLLKTNWNEYLFTKIIPIAWEILLKESCKYITKDDIYAIWPTSIKYVVDSSSSLADSRPVLWKNILQDIVNLLDPNLQIYRGPSVISSLDNNNSSKGYLSLRDGYFTDEKSEKISTILEEIGFPLFVKMPSSIIEALKNSKSKSSMRYISPDLVCDYLSKNLDMWQNKWNYDYKIELLEYVIQTTNPSALHNLPLIPLGDKTFGTFGPRNQQIIKTLCIKNEQSLISQNLSEYIVDNEVKKEIWERLCEIVESNWNINLKFLDDKDFSCFLERSITGYSSETSEIPLNDQVTWIHKLWDHFVETNRNLDHYEHLPLLIIQRRNGPLYLRKLNAEPKCLKYNHKNYYLRETINIFDLLGVTFLENKFLTHRVLKWEK